MRRRIGLDGSAPNGTWNLFVSDSFGGDVGSLTAWSFDLTAGACAGKAAAASANVGTGGNDTVVGTPAPDVCRRQGR